MSKKAYMSSMSDVTYLLRSLAHMRGEISSAQEAVRLLSEQLETWRTWHEDLEQEITQAIVDSGSGSVGAKCSKNKNYDFDRENK